MRQTTKARHTLGIRGQLMWFLCFICLFLLGLFWLLSTQLLEPLYTKHIETQLTNQAAIYNLKSGMPLQIKANGCTDFHGNEILRFSRKFQNTLEELDKKGYRLKEEIGRASCRERV